MAPITLAALSDTSVRSLRGGLIILIMAFAYVLDRVSLTDNILRPGTFHHVKKPARVAVRSPTRSAGPMVLDPPRMIGLDNLDGAIAQARML
jgi:hypothetical protein